MEFCKIKPKHILFNDLTHAQIGQIVIIQCLAASLDRLPSEKEILRFMSQKQLKSVKDHLQNTGKTLEEVLQKVIEDVGEVLQTREYWKIKQREHRKNITKSTKTVIDGQDVRLELDKIRVNTGEVAIAPGDIPIKTAPVIKKPTPTFAPPSLEEVSKYCAERGSGVSPQKWMNHYEAKGWMIGKAKMKDWKAAVRTWEPDLPIKAKETFDEAWERSVEETRRRNAEG